jgi:hypothetical protein
MQERRAQPRYQLIPPLRGRVFIDAVGQFDAQLLDVSVEGVRLLLQMDNPDDLARFLAAKEKNMTATFARPGDEPWKFALLHTRSTTLDAPAGKGVACMIASRFVSVPNFTVADLDRLVAERQAARV